MSKQIEIEYKDHFTVGEYFAIVNNIADGFFNEDGSFAPHVGDVIAMVTFFNECVVNKEDILDVAQIEDVEEVENELFANEAFIEAFNDAIYFEGEIKFDFANAFKCAMEIVTNRNNSIPMMVASVMNKLTETINNINKIMTEDNVESLTEFAKAITDENFNAEAVVNAFANSDAFKAIAELNQENSK